MTILSAATIKTEEWKDIPKYPNFQASTFGRIKNTKTGNILTPTYAGPHRRKYGQVWVSPRKREWVHRLVAKAFHGDKSDKLIVCHINDDQFDNRPENLKWSTYSENTKDSIKNGTYCYLRGELNGNSKLTDYQRKEIKEMYTGKRGEQTALARRYGVSISLINLIVRR